MSPVGSAVGGGVWDRDDRRLVAALQHDVRVSAERAGAVLGLAPRHVGRRWSALLAEGSLRLSATRAPGPGSTTSLWRLVLDPSAGPGSPAAVLAALADRADVHEVQLTAPGDEVLVTETTRADPGTGTGRGAGLGSGAGGARAGGSGGPRGVGGLRGVTSARAVVVLHRYADERPLDVLTGAERAALTPMRPSAPVPLTRVDAGEADEDARVLAVLRADPRASAVAVAAATGWPASTARRRLTVLLGSGRIRTRVHLDAARLGLGTRAHLHLQLPPGRVDAVAGALREHDAVHELLAVTGAAPLRASVAARDLDHLHLLLTRDLPALAGGALTGVETVLLAP